MSIFGNLFALINKLWW